MARRQKITPTGKIQMPLPETFTLGTSSWTNTPSPNVRTIPNKIEREAIQEILVQCAMAGVDRNAIVCRREKPGEIWRRTSHLQWGVVDHMNHVMPYGHTLYKPICVRWFSSAAHHGVMEEHFDLDELYVVHSHLPDTLMEQIFDAQDEE